MAVEGSNMFQTRRRCEQVPKIPRSFWTTQSSQKKQTKPFLQNAQAQGTKKANINSFQNHKAPWTLKEWRYDIDTDTNPSWDAKKPAAINEYVSGWNMNILFPSLQTTSSSRTECPMRDPADRFSQVLQLHPKSSLLMVPVACWPQSLYFSYPEQIQRS